MFPNNLGIIVGCISLVLFCNFGKAKGCSKHEHDDHENDYSGCPSIDDVDVMDSNYKRFVCAETWEDQGDSSGACNGQRDVWYGDTKREGREGYYIAVGSILIKNGCTFTGYEDYDFNGDVIRYNGPNIYPDGCKNGDCPPVGDNYYETHGFLSCKCECDQKPINCDPTDKWETVFDWENDSSTPIKYTYEKEIGTTWTSEVENSFSIGTAIENTLSAGFWKVFDDELGFSATTNYDWSDVSSSVKSRTVTTTVEVEVPPYTRLIIEAAQGLCDGNIVHTDKFRSSSLNKDGNIVSETIEPQIFSQTGKIISGQEKRYKLPNNEVKLEEIGN